MVSHSYPRGLVGGGLNGSGVLVGLFRYFLRVYRAHWGRMAGDSAPVVVYSYTVSHSSAVQNDSRLETVGHATLTRSRWWLRQSKYEFNIRAVPYELHVTDNLLKTLG